LEDNTLLIFTSDNGPHNEGGHSYKYFDSAGPLRGFKRSLYEGGIREPMIMKWPNNKAMKPGTTTSVPIAFWDFLPTFASIANAKIPPNVELDGINVQPAMEGQSLPTRPLYWEFCTNNKWGHAVRYGNWKAVSFSLMEKFELYNITEDIGESNNVAATNAEVVAQLQAMAQKMHRDDPNWPKVHCVSS